MCKNVAPMPQILIVAKLFYFASLSTQTHVDSLEHMPGE